MRHVTLITTCFATDGVEKVATGQPCSAPMDYLLKRVNMLKYFGVKPWVVLDGRRTPMKVRYEYHDCCCDLSHSFTHVPSVQGPVVCVEKEERRLIALWKYLKRQLPLTELPQELLALCRQILGSERHRDAIA